MPRTIPFAPLALLALSSAATPAAAKPFAPDVFCSEGYPGELSCALQPPACGFCHESTQPPVVMNDYGAAVSAALGVYVPPPYAGKDAEFQANLVSALRDVEALDSDGDGHENLEEIELGSFPGDPDSLPVSGECPDAADLEGWDYRICSYDHRFVYRKIGIDFCGLPPTFEELEAFAELSDDDKLATLHDALDECLDSEFWLGENGVLWSIAHRKIRPVSGLQGFADYTYDYEYFTYTQIDGHDVRDVLVGQYLVERLDVGTAGAPESVYQIVETVGGQPLQPERRVGLVAPAWPLFYNTMFTALPRTTAAQAYRAFLGLDIAKSEGLFPVTGEPFDYDEKGVDAAACATCHSTLDPLSYPFATYNGLQGDAEIGPYSYDQNRIAKYFVAQFPLMAAMPEAGSLFGQPVADLLEWAQVASESDQFYIATTTDYWRLLIGATPDGATPEQLAELELLWQGLREHLSVEQMLHAFIETEAYGAP